MGTDPLAVERITLDTDVRDARIDGTLLNLTPREFELLQCLMHNSSNVVTTRELLEAIWGTSSVGDGHAVEVYVSRLRAKLNGHLRSSEVIRTVRGRGFMFVQPREFGRSVHILADDNLIVRQITPDGEPFLGWQPQELIDTAFILALQPWLHGEPAAAQALATYLINEGIVDISGPFAVPSADGNLHLVDGSARLLSDGNTFTGMETLLHL